MSDPALTATAPRGRRATDGFAVVLAAAVAAGAWIAEPVPGWLLVPALVAGVLARRRPVAVVVVAALLASWSGARAWAGMTPPPAGELDAVATLLDDPERLGGSVRARLRVHGRHLEGWARGAAGVALERRLAGERLAVVGRVSSRPVADWQRVEHVVARVDVDEVRGALPAHPLPAAANAVRRSFERGARGLTDARRALLAGLVVGDDRHQSPEVRDDFRGSGLAHLLAVSGQNVAFVLVLAAPLTARLAPPARLAGVVAVLVLFATVTRFEPSVLRATAMAALATTAGVLGRPTRPLRLLALAVTGLVLADPFLVRSVGFGLSVSASAGILLWADALGRAVPGPRALARALGVVVAAQAAVAPLQLLVFGGVPVVGPLANLAAEPVAGLVMLWGSSAGVVAGLLPERVAALVHVPTGPLLDWVSGVARTAAGAGLGELGPAGCGLLAGAVLAVSRPWVRARRWAAVVACLVAGGVLATPAVHARLAHGPRSLPGVGTLTTDRGLDHAVLEVESGARPADVLRALRTRGVRRLERLVVPDAGARGAAVASLVARRIGVAEVAVDATSAVGAAGPGAPTADPRRPP